MRILTVVDYQRREEYKQLRDALLDQRIRFFEKDLELGHDTTRAIFVWEDDFERARKVLLEAESRIRMKGSKDANAQPGNGRGRSEVRKTIENIGKNLTVLTLSTVFLILIFVYWLVWM